VVAASSMCDGARHHCVMMAAEPQQHSWHAIHFTQMIATRPSNSLIQSSPGATVRAVRSLFPLSRVGASSKAAPRLTAPRANWQDDPSTLSAAVENGDT